MNAKSVSVAGAAVVIFCTAAATTIFRGNNEHPQALADRLVTAPAEGVPYVLQDLLPVRTQAVDRLREHLQNPHLDLAARLHAAYGLADLDPQAQQFLLDAVAAAPHNECRNLIAALALVQPSAAPEAAVRANNASDPTLRARYAIVALHLGNPQPAQTALTISEDPLQRTTFLHTFAAWHGHPEEVAAALLTSDDAAFRSGLCAAVGTLACERGRAIGALATLYLQSPDGGTHSAAGWALRQWEQPLPATPPATRPASGRRWFVNTQGITMIELAPGTFRMGTAGQPPFDDESPAHEVTLTRPFYLADREITVEQFLRFVADADCPVAEKPQLWEGISIECSPTTDCPVQMVNWFDAVLYCNWLSGREERQPCYTRSGKQRLKDYAGVEEEQDVWRCDFGADGYRLPTEAEWEYAARAGSCAAYCFGPGSTRLQEYCWLLTNSSDRTWPGGQKLPNAWGLFDMHGSVWEWCWDYEADYRSDAINDPTGPDVGDARMLRGGAFGVGALGCRSAFRFCHRPTYRSTGYGIRICCGP